MKNGRETGKNNENKSKLGKADYITPGRTEDFLYIMKIVIKGSPGGRFEHLGVETGSKIHAEHDEHSEIIS